MEVYPGNVEYNDSYTRIRVRCRQITRSSGQCVLGCTAKIRCHQPLIQRGFGALEQRADRDRELLKAVVNV